MAADCKLPFDSEFCAGCESYNNCMSLDEIFKYFDEMIEEECVFVFDLESCEGCIKYDKCLDDYLHEDDMEDSE